MSTIEAPAPTSVVTSVTTPSLAAAVNAAQASKMPKGLKQVPLDESLPDYLHCLLYGYTSSYKTTTAALFGGPERTLIISTRDPEQVRIPLSGLGFHNIISANDSESLIWAMQNCEKAADGVGFPEWKDREDRVLMVDDWTEGAALLVDDNSVRDDGSEVKDGRKIYGETKTEVREVLNSLKRRRMHIIFTALADETDWDIYPAMPKGARRHIEAAFDYVFYMKKKTGTMLTVPGTEPYPAKDEKTGKAISRLRDVFAKRKIPFKLRAAMPPVLANEEKADLVAVWGKIVAARGVK